MAESDAVLVTRGLRKTFESEGAPVRALRGVDFSMGSGEFVAGFVGVLVVLLRGSEGRPHVSEYYVLRHAPADKIHHPKLVLCLR
jgi:hypothetical protein